MAGLPESSAQVIALRELLNRSPVRRQVVVHLKQGCSRKEIASRMNKSPHAIDAHIKAIYRIVEIGDRAVVVLLASQVLETALDPSPPPESGTGVQA
jgi:DNA-binding NarL/FixJ family response regulator